MMVATRMINQLMKIRVNEQRKDDPP
jgi:hypothetical protein